MTDVIQIWNRAVSAAGGVGNIVDINEVSPEADLCRLWYSGVRDRVLKAAPWPCAAKNVALTKVATRNPAVAWSASAPAPGYLYAYSVPTDLLSPRYLHSYQRFERALLGAEYAFHTNDPEAILCYTHLPASTTTWDDGLTWAVTYALASSIANALSAKQSTINDLRSRADEAILLARAEDANEEQLRIKTVPAWLQARGYSSFEAASPVRFYWPYETVSGVTP